MSFPPTYQQLSGRKMGSSRGQRALKLSRLPTALAPAPRRQPWVNCPSIQLDLMLVSFKTIIHKLKLKHHFRFFKTNTLDLKVFQLHTFSSQCNLTSGSTSKVRDRIRPDLIPGPWLQPPSADHWPRSWCPKMTACR